MTKITYRGLIIESKWVDKILSGEKIWEIRGSKFGKEKIGKIALIKIGTGKIYGNCDLVKFEGPLSKKELRDNRDKHCIEKDKINCVMGRYNCQPYVWVLENPKPIHPPIAYRRERGQQIWVILFDNKDKDKIFAEKNTT